MFAEQTVYPKRRLLPALQTVEALIKSFIIPFVGHQLVVGVDDGESINQMGAEERVHVLRHVFSSSGPILGPVGEVACHPGGRGCMLEKGLLRSACNVTRSWSAQPELVSVSYPAGTSTGPSLQRDHKY